MKSYINCTTHRSGTHFLKDLLAINNCGFPDEKFWYLIDGMRLTLGEFIKKGTKNGVFGMSIHPIVFARGMGILKEMSRMQGEDDFHVLNTIFPNIKFIYLYRENIIKQAISLEKTVRSGHYVLRDNPDFGEYSEKNITNKISFLKKENEEWVTFFNEYNIMPHVLTYESLCLDTPKNIQDILNFLGIKRDFINTEVSREIQYDETSEEWYQRYIHEKGEKINEIFSDNLFVMFGNRHSC